MSELLNREPVLQGNKKGRILFVEDDRIDQIAFERLEKKEDFHYAYTMVGTVEEAQNVLDSEEFDAVVADYMLEDGTAFDLIEKIKNTPIIIVTGSGDEKIAVRAMKMGASDYLIKDPDFNYLKILSITIDNAISRMNAEEELKRSREELRNLYAHLQTVREKERTHIAREIHDELGQILTSLKMYLSNLTQKLPQDEKPLLEKAKTMSELIDTCIKTVQRITEDLRPSLLDNIGLIPAMEWHIKEFQKHTGIKCRITTKSFDIEEMVLDKDRITVIFRIFQETLTNVARHSDATVTKVNLKKEGPNLILTIKDNGKGIKKDELSSPKSFGIIGIRERASFVGGNVRIKGIKGKGTTVTVTIPFFRRKKR